MHDMSKWIDRRFQYAPPRGEYPMIVERLRGTPDRVEKKIASLPRQLLTSQPEADTWSIQEHIGHLIDLESLWSTRLDELLSGAEKLSAADMTNRRTYDAHHNERPVSDIVGQFRWVRLGLVDRLDALDDDKIEATSLHPRLNSPMRTIDLCLFVAEHDDHHLAIITRLQRQLAGVEPPRAQR